MSAKHEEKPGWKTSEFWLHILAQLPGLVGMFAGADHKAVLALAAVNTVAASVYSGGRSHVKAKRSTARQDQVQEEILNTMKALAAVKAGAAAASEQLDKK